MRGDKACLLNATVLNVVSPFHVFINWKDMYEKQIFYISSESRQVRNFKNFSPPVLKAPIYFAKIHLSEKIFSS